MSYVDDVLAQMKEKDAHEPEFLQVLTEILDSLRPIIEANEEKYRKEALLERLVEPEKVAYFRVPWTDDQGQAHQPWLESSVQQRNRPVQGWYPLPSHR